MLTNYLRIALRNLGKNKIYSAINITGFAIGVTCSLLILLWVYDELTFDAYLPKYEKVYRVMVEAEYEGRVNVWNTLPGAAGQSLQDEHTNIANVVMTDYGADHLLADASKSDRSGIRKKGHYTTDAFLDVFQHKMIHGDPSTALKDMTSIVLTESLAKLLFGDRNPMDKTVRFDDHYDLKVTGVISDVPENSNIKFEYLVTWKLYEEIPWVKGTMEAWDTYSYPVYVELSDPADKTSVEGKIRSLLTRHGETDFRKELFLYPISRMRLHSNFENGVEAGGMIVYVQMFSLIAAFIMLIACINFMNLATARSAKRAVEVGVRKSVGSRRFDLISQFIGESIVTTAFAFAAGLILAQMLLPFYNELVSKQLAIPYQSWEFWLISLVMIVFTGTLAGSYPAFYLSAFKPVKVLKGARSGSGGTLPRRILVTTQFGFSMLLIIATIVVYQQIQHVRDRDLGYKSSNLLSVPMSDDIRKNYKPIKDALLATGVVEAATKSNTSISQINSWGGFTWPGNLSDQKHFFAMLATEYDFVKTTGVKLIEGRDFSQEFRSDTAAIIVNKAAIDLMGLKEPIGARILNGTTPYEIIGVVENTLSESPYDPVGPMAVLMNPWWASTVMIRITEGAPIDDALKKIEGVFKTYSPAYPFEYTFADETFQQKFTNITLTSRLASIFAVLTLVITGLGLFGLAAFTAEQRTKEMGIRKVMGASVGQLVQLVTTDFTVLVVVAFIVSSPLAWWLMNEYLQQYNYRVDIQWWIFPLTGVVALVFALVIVSTQALRAANSNPARSLRSE